MRAEQHSGTDLEGCTIRSADGEKLGKVEEIHVDEQGMPQYLEVRSGWFGARHHLIPAAGLTRSEDDLIAPYTKAQLEDAPVFEPGEDVDFERERHVGGHFGHSVRNWEAGRDDWLAGEDLSRGPTPETRHPEGGRDDVHDTTEGPTPETRRAERLDEALSGRDPGAAADRDTRQMGGGTQDIRDDDRRGRDLRDDEMPDRHGAAHTRQVRLLRAVHFRGNTATRR